MMIDIHIASYWCAGKTKFQTGYWIGVQYDEPFGKHNGRWVRPCSVTTLPSLCCI